MIFLLLERRWLAFVWKRRRRGSWWCFLSPFDFCPLYGPKMKNGFLLSRDYQLCWWLMVWHVLIIKISNGFLLLEVFFPKWTCSDGAKKISNVFGLCCWWVERQGRGSVAGKNVWPKNKCTVLSKLKSGNLESWIIVHGKSKYGRSRWPYLLPRIFFEYDRVKVFFFFHEWPKSVAVFSLQRQSPPIEGDSFLPFVKVAKC